MTEDQSHRPEVVLVAAVADNGVIGRGGGLPWHLPEDLRHFKKVTLGHPVIMGRRTFESLGRALPGRRNIVITRQKGWSAPGAERAESLDAALASVAPGAVAMVIGGADIFARALPLADRIELTEVHSRPEGDTLFPHLDREDWREATRDERPAQDGRPGCSFVTLTRRVREDDNEK